VSEWVIPLHRTIPASRTIMNSGNFSGRLSSALGSRAVGPELAGEALGDDGDEAIAVGRVEVSSGAKRDVQSLKIAGADEAEIGARELGFGTRIVFGLDDIDPALALQRQIRRDGRRFDPGWLHARSNASRAREPAPSVVIR